jgi:transcriptional repressor NrdR
MKCPFCGHAETQVVENPPGRRCQLHPQAAQMSRSAKNASPPTSGPRSASRPSSKKDGRRIEYATGKLRDSFALALRKRPVSTEQVDAAIERIEEKLLNLGAREIPSHQLGEMVMRELKKLDKVAYVRFASVYRSFEDIDEFKTLVDEVRS